MGSWFSRTTKSTDVDVLIIGAGPAGLMACNALIRAGVSVMIIDKRPVKVAAGQADGIQPRTIEVLQSYGLAERLLKEANQMHTAAFYNPNPATGEIELTDRAPDITEQWTNYPFECTLHQGEIEAIFLDFIRSSGVEIRRQTVPVSIQIDEEGSKDHSPTSYPVRVVVQNEATSQSEIVNAKYVLGADGAHSWVRKYFDIKMEGEQTEYVWGVIDLVPDTNFPDVRNKTLIHSSNGACMIIPREGDKIRLYIQLGSADAGDNGNGRVDKSHMTPEKLLDVARKSFHPYHFNQPEEFEWWTIYRIGQRVASQFSVQNRVFIAGDACHTHSPKAGQGMNASMNDSHNLAWKIAYVIRGWANSRLLSSYELERRTFARDLINFDKQFSKLFSDKPKSHENGEGVSHDEFISAFKKFGGFTSGIGIRYTDSPLVDPTYASCVENLSIGTRIPPQPVRRAFDSRPFNLHDLLPSDTRFKVFVFVGDTSNVEQRARLSGVSEQLESRLKEHSPSGDVSQMYTVYSISACSNAVNHANELPDFLRSHWSKLYVSASDQIRDGHDAYSKFGISPKDGAVVLIRPDGYIGFVCPLDNVATIGSYLSTFVKSTA